MVRCQGTVIAGTHFRIFAPPGIVRNKSASGTLSILNIEADSGVANGTRCLFAGYDYESPLAGVHKYIYNSPGEISHRQTGKNFAGIYYTLHRHYDPILMRFTSPDPAASPFYNLHSYVGNNPARYVDPDGLSYGELEDGWDKGGFGGIWDAWTNNVRRVGSRASNNADYYANDENADYLGDVGTGAAGYTAGAADSISPYLGDSVANAWAGTGVDINSDKFAYGRVVGNVSASVITAAATGGSSTWAKWGARALTAIDVGHVGYAAATGDIETALITGGAQALGFGLGRLARNSNKICFVAGTQVVVENDEGQKANKSIEDIEVGDMVWSRDDRTGESGFKPVVQLFTTSPTALVHMSYRRDSGSAWRGAKRTSRASDSDDPDSELVGTHEHPFWSLDRAAWVPMGELRIGERMYLLDGSVAVVSGTWVETLDNTENQTALEDGHFTTYNFEVADWHTFFVAPEEAAGVYSAVWVHNRGGPCGGFSNGRSGEKWYAGSKAGATRGGKGSSIDTRGLGRRHPDVTVANRNRIVEIKTGNVRYSRFVRRQIRKDRRIRMQGLRNGNGMKVKQVTWHFYRSKIRGANSFVDRRIIRMLDRAGIHHKLHGVSIR